MSYQDLFKKAIKSDRLQPLTMAVQKWEKDGDQLLGELLTIEDFTGSEYDTPCKKYTFHTDNGIVSTVLGSIGDKTLSEKHVGKVIHIMYQGKKESKNGRRFNIFMISIVGK